MQCATMAHRRKLTMNWDGLRDDDEDDLFFESRERISSVAPQEMPSLASLGTDAEDFEDSRMSFTSTISSASSTESNHSNDANADPSSMLAGYDMWMAEPGDIRERRKRLLQGMGLASTKGMLRMASTKIARTISRKREDDRHSTVKVGPPSLVTVNSAPQVVKVDSRPGKELRIADPPPPSSSHSHATAVVFRRSRSDSDIDAFSGRAKDRLSNPDNNRLQSVSDGSFDSVFLIKNLDTGKEFVVKEYNEQGMWNKLSDVQTGKQLTMEEFEKSVGQSRLVKELMRRNGANSHDGRKINQLFAKSFRNSKRKGVALLKNIKVKSLSHKEHEHSSTEEQSGNKAPSQWVKARQHGKSYKEFTALHMSQEIQAHQGSIWVIKFSLDGRFLASAGEDKALHVWEVQECEVASTRPTDDSNSASSTPVHLKAGIVTDRPQLAEITPMSSKKKSKSNKKKANSIPDYVNMPETVFALSEKPVCTFQGHQDDVLDISWSTSQVCCLQLLLSSSMDKSVRMWDLETKSCLKKFAHTDYGELPI